eukprot:5463146-Alexandrium_andersonii.AAC.1
MSASLVGSEMCIRDRSDTATRSPEYPARFSYSARNPAQARRGPISVSYTHLTLPTICSV